jgi:GT2 family glycosyltransferase
MTRLRGFATDASTTVLVRVHLEQPIPEIRIEWPQRDALVIALWNGSAIGQVAIVGRGTHSASHVRSILLKELGDRVARRALSGEAQRTLDGEPAPSYQPDVSVVIATRRRPELLAGCLDSLEHANHPPAEIIVVDNAPDDPATATLCRHRLVRYMALGNAPLSRLRNVALDASHELVAFIDDDCVADPAWLDDIGRPFADPLLAAITGYVGPAEFAHAAQRLFELHGGFDMSYEPRVFDCIQRPAVLSASALGDGNVVFRRAALEAVGGYDERLGPGTPIGSKQDAEIFYRLLRSGQRVLLDPARVVWHRHRPDRRALRKVLHDYARGDSAYATLSLIERRELDAVQLWAWWWRTHLPRDIRRLVRRDGDALPLDCILAEALGTLRGPAAYLAARGRKGEPRVAAPRNTGPAERLKAVTVGVTTPSVSVVIPSHNRRDLLVKVLAGLREQTALGSMEVIVVLDGCTDRSGDAVQAGDWPFPLTLLEQDGVGVGAARNRGARAARNDLLVFLDDDLVPGPDLVAEHAVTHDRHPGGVTQGYHPLPVTYTGPLAAMMRMWWEDHFRRKGQLGRPWSFLDACAGNSALSRTLLMDHGGFDESCARGEDQELAIRLLESGVMWRYVPTARGTHHIDLDLAKLIRDRKAEGRSHLAIARRHPVVWPRLAVSTLCTPEGLAPQLDRAFTHPLLIDAAIAGGITAARALDRAGLRARWLRMVQRLQMHAYARGVSQAAGTPAELYELRAAGERAGGDMTGRFVLGPGGGIEPLPSSGTSSLQVWRGGQAVAIVRAADPGQQWDADVVIARVASMAAGQLGSVIASELIAGAAP